MVRGRLRSSDQPSAVRFQPIQGGGLVTESQPVIDAQNIMFSYGSRDILKALTLTVNRGEIFGKLGDNGAGKTTFIRILVWMLKLNSGSIRVLGEAPSTRQAR
ncbi:MAG TPA: hypothetical protein DDY93_14045 [Dehalococcoidia bacterium]|nr:hypothetical protein [Dehalococcoidia bacterium]